MKLAWIACGCLAAACLTLAWQQAPVPPQVPQAPARGIIEGQVLNAATGAPLKRAAVQLTGIGRPPQGGMPNRFNKETDEQGRFSFSSLEAGRYQISAQRTGYLSQNYGARKYSGGGTPLILSADQRVRDVLFKLSPQSVITGKVLDEDGEPVANVQVRALKYAYRGGKKQWVQSGDNVQTSDIGEFRIPKLEPARYIVSANPNNRGNTMQTVSNEPLPETPEMIFTSTFYPSTTDQVSAVPIDLGAGTEMRGIDIRLRRTRVFRVRGIVAGMTAAGGRGQVMVRLSPKEGPQGQQPESQARPPDNRFEIRGVAPGSYILHTLPRGQNQPIAFMPIEVTANHVDNVVLSVFPGVDVPGSIKIEDATAPIEANLTVNLQPAIPMGGAPRAKAGEGLNFKLTNVMPVKYRVSVSGLPEGCFVKSIQYGGLDVPDDGIEMMSSAPIQITVSATAGEILAGVVDKEGKPVPNALVALIPKDGKAIRANSSDEAGGATFRSIKPGDYRIMAFEDIPQGAYQDPEFIKPFEGSAASISLEPRGRQAVQVKVIPASETDK